MICNYFRVIRIPVEKIIIGRTTQPTHDVPGTSPEGPLKVLTSGTYRQLSGDQYKNWWFCEKIVFQKYYSLYYMSVSAFYKKNK